MFSTKLLIVGPVAVATESFFTWSGNWLGYIVNIFFFVGGVVSALAFADRWKHRHEKRKQEAFGAAVENEVEAQLDEILGPMVKTQVGEEVRASLESIASQVADIHKQTRDNNGSSMTDSQKRLEEEQRKMNAVLAELKEGQALQLLMSKNQQALIEKVDQTMTQHLRDHSKMAMA